MPLSRRQAHAVPARRAMAADAAIGTVLAVLMLLGGLTGVTPSGPEGPLRAGALVLALAVAAALTIRRQAPVAALLALNALVATWYVLNYPGRLITAAALIGCYTVAAVRGWRWGVAGWLLTAVTSVAVIHLTLGGPMFGDTVLNALVLELAATALGVAVWYHRAFAADAADHAEQLARVRVERSRLRDAEDRLAIARDLHDAIGHSLVAISVHAGVAGHVAGREPRATAEALQTIKTRSDEGLAEVHVLLGALREMAPKAGRPGLGHLDRLLEVTRCTGVTVHLVVHGEPRALAPRVDVAAFRIVQEALTNARRHARPSRIDVTVAYVAEALGVRVRNDGTEGADPAPASPGGGHGIAGMAARAAELGGTCTAGLATSGYFEVSARLPLRDQA